jgi:dTDP-4-amino-4,6-dideoxy-D-galactose acyltransferase
MSNILENLDWDSSFFGYPVAKIKAEQIPVEKLSALIKQAQVNAVKLIYLFTDPLDEVSVNSANLTGAKLVDRKIIFHKKIDGSDVSTLDDHIELFMEDLPSGQLVNLSIQSGLYSRYKIDPGFKNNEFEKLYIAWIENSVSKKIADHTFVYKENGIVLGFVTLKVKDSFGQIGLIAVDEGSRGKAIGKKLITAVSNQLLQDNIPDIEVATQMDNVDACNFYKKVGFTGIKTENIFHIWLK